MGQLYKKVWQGLLQSRIALGCYKKVQALLKSGSGNLLQSSAVAHYKVQQILERWATLLENGTDIRKWGSYYKVGQCIDQRYM